MPGLFARWSVWSAWRGWPAAPRRVWFLLAALSVLVLAVRVWPRLQDPQLWAEDGMVFLQDVYVTGFWGSIFKPYADYLHLVPRLVAWFSSAFPLEIVPYAMFWTAFAVLALFILATPVLIEHAALRLAILVIFPLSVGTNELYIPPTNLQWFLAVYGIDLCMRRIRPVDWVLIPVMAITGPFLAIAVATRLVQFAEAETRARLGVWTAALVLGGAVLGYTLFRAEIDTTVRVILDSLGSAILFVGPQETRDIVLAALALFVLAWWTRLAPDARYLVLFFVIYWVSIGYKFGVQQSHPGPKIFVAGGRYFFLPQLLVFALLVRAAVPQQGVRLVPQVAGVAVAATIIWLCEIFLTTETLTPFPGSHAENWLPAVAEYRRSGNPVLPILPEGWFMRVE
ncbi:MAG: hypothetical protein AAGC86_07160 [Pseudomonadota bacterium]